MTRQLFRTAFVLFALALLDQTVLEAQYQGLSLRGDVGVESGTQPGPGYYLTFPLYYRNDYTGLRDASGREILSGLNLNINLLAPALSVTTKAKILGATYGFAIVPAWMNQRITLAQPGVQSVSGYGFGDMYFQPINLGWRTKRADYMAAYGFFAPTGSTGRTLDMWAHEIVLGTTVYLDSAKKWNASVAGSYDINQKKRSQDLRVGDILTVEGGAARSFLKGAAHAGLAYVAQWKITNDSGSAFPSLIPKSKGRAFGLGPDLAMPVFAKGTFLGLVSFRYIWEFGAETNFEGRTLVVSLTLAKLNIK
jgi:hypothetical protein